MSPPLLLDTCIILWLLAGDDRIVNNQDLMKLLGGRSRFFSSVSISEIEIKKSVGKLEIPPAYLESIIETGIRELPYTSHDAQYLGSLPFHHKDPFDRMLIGTAMNKGMMIVTADPVFSEYPIQVYSI